MVRRRYIHSKMAPRGRPILRAMNRNLPSIRGPLNSHVQTATKILTTGQQSAWYRGAGSAEGLQTFLPNFGKNLPAIRKGGGVPAVIKKTGLDRSTSFLENALNWMNRGGTAAKVARWTTAGLVVAGGIAGVTALVRSHNMKRRAMQRSSRVNPGFKRAGGMRIDGGIGATGDLVPALRAGRHG